MADESWDDYVRARKAAAVTFWGKHDLRDVLRIALARLDEHYSAS